MTTPLQQKIAVRSNPTSVHPSQVPAHLALVQRVRGRRLRHGFTLVEMVVSLSAGLLIAMAAFLLARNSSKVFQHEANVTSAQFGVVIGMTRLQADLRRASFMGSPNVMQDDRLCGNTAGWPAAMREIAGIRIEEDGSFVRHPADHDLSTANGLTPDALIIGGMFGTTEQYSVAVVMPGAGGGTTILLQNDGAMLRTQASAGQGGLAIAGIFELGRYLRIVDKVGRHGYGIISGVNTAHPSGMIAVTVANAPALPTRNTQGTCGCEGFCTGALVNPVSRVLYDLRTINTGTYPRYAALYRKARHGSAGVHQGAVSEPDRTELIRVELDAQGQEIINTFEVIAEYAVDLKFGIIEDNPNQATTSLSRELIGAQGVYDTAASLIGGGTPENIRAVQVRLSIRSPRRDRSVQLQWANPPPPETGVFRYCLDAANACNDIANPPPMGFSRVRTLIADVQIPNQARRMP